MIVSPLVYMAARTLSMTTGWFVSTWIAKQGKVSEPRLTVCAYCNQKRLCTSSNSVFMAAVQKQTFRIDSRMQWGSATRSWAARLLCELFVRSFACSNCFASSGTSYLCTLLFRFKAFIKTDTSFKWWNGNRTLTRMYFFVSMTDSK